MASKPKHILVFVESMISFLSVLYLIEPLDVLWWTEYIQSKDWTVSVTEILRVIHVLRLTSNIDLKKQTSFLSLKHDIFGPYWD